MITLTAVGARSGCSRMLSSAAPFPAATRLPQLSHAYHSCTSRTQQQLQRSLPYTLCRPVSSSGSIVRWRVQSHWSAPVTCAAVRRYSSDAGAALGRVVPTHLQVLFTCTVCSHRSAALMSKQSYTSGVVLIRCDGCKKLHLFADHLGWFDDVSVTIEDIMKQKAAELNKLEIATNIPVKTQQQQPAQHQEPAHKHDHTHAHAHKHSHSHSQQHTVDTHSRTTESPFHSDSNSSNNITAAQERAAASITTSSPSHTDGNSNRSNHADSTSAAANYTTYDALSDSDKQLLTDMHLRMAAEKATHALMAQQQEQRSSAQQTDCNAKEKKEK